MKSCFVKFILFLTLSNSLWAHRDFWEIKATALPEPGKLTFSVFLSLDQLNELIDTIQYPSYKQANRSELIEKVAAAAPNLLQVKSNGKELVPFVKSVNISTKSFDDAENTDLSPAQVDVDIELIFSYETSIEDIAVKWNIFADKMIMHRTQDKSKLPEGANDVSIYFFDQELSKFKVNSKNPSFTWQIKNQTVPPGLRLKTNNVVTQEFSKGTLFLGILLFLSGVLLWATTIKRSYSILAIVFISMAPLSILFSKTDQTVISHSLPAKDEISTFMSYALKKIYLSVNSVGSDSKWSPLNNIASDGFKEDIFVSSYNDSAKRITHFVEGVEIISVKQIDDNSIECLWKAHTIFQHLSHIHEKSISFQGVFHFAEKENMWLIDKSKVRRIL